MDESRIWLLLGKKISNEATQEELVELEAIFQTIPDLQYAYSLINEIKGPCAKDYGLGEDEENSIIEKKLGELNRVLQSGRNGKKTDFSKILLRRIKWAAACLLVLMVFSLGYYIHSKKEYHKNTAEVTRKGNKVYVADSPTSITLQDGTRVWLNRGSTLKCAPRYGSNERRVILLGEAYFEVTENAEKPFIVEASHGMKIQVLGTTFNVKAYPADPYFETSLINGRIAVNVRDNKKSQVILEPHEKITIYLGESEKDKNNADVQSDNPVKFRINTITPNPVDQHISELSWMRGELAFNDITFEELAYDLERIFHVSIYFKQEEIRNSHLTGVFKDENLNEVLQALQVTTPFQYNISNKEVTIYH